MTQWVKALAAEVEDMSSILRSQLLERELTPTCCPLTFICLLWHMYTLTHTK